MFFTDVYIDTIFKVAGGFSTGAQTAVDTWTQQFWALANANMTTNGTITAIGNISTTNGNISATNGSIRGKCISSSLTITATGNITGATASCTGTGKPKAPTGVGVFWEWIPLLLPVWRSVLAI